MQKYLRPIHHDDNSRRDNKHECLKGVMEGQKLTQTFAAIAMQMQHKRIAGALA